MLVLLLLLLLLFAAAAEAIDVNVVVELVKNEAAAEDLAIGGGAKS